MDKLHFLSPSAGESEPVSAPEPAPAPEPAGSEGPARGPDGKFAAKEPAPAASEVVEPAPAPEPPAPAAAPQAAPPDPVHVPLTAHLDEREKRQRAEAELARLKAQQPTAPAFTPPNRDEDPEGFEAYREALIDERLRVQSRDFSRRLAEVAHGKETVQQAHEWGFAKCAADPLFNQKVMQSEDPYELVVSEWQRDQLLSRFSDKAELDAFNAWKAAQANPQSAPPPAAATPAAVTTSITSPTPPPPPPRSLAGASSAGGPATVPVGPGRAYDGAFGPKR